MELLKPVSFFVGSSLFLHGLLIGSFYVSPDPLPVTTGNVAIISTVEYSPKAPQKLEVSKSMVQRPSLVTKKHPLTGVRNSTDFLMDPKNGKIFINYFTTIKEKITRTIQKRYAIEGGGKGSVELIFVLNPDGHLENAWVSKEQTDADETAKIFALDCLKTAAPFGPFPKELGIEKISFNVSVFF